MGADSHNAMGYWESTEVADLNDAILDAAGSRWDDWEAFDPQWYDSAVAGDLLERAQAVLTNEFGDSRLFVLKDPRICRLLEFWKVALDRVDAAPVVALPIRNPLEVAASLRVRDEFDPSIGVLIWLRHVLDAEAGSRGMRRTFIRYEDVLEDRKSLAIRLGSELDVTWPPRSTLDEREMESLISSSIRHHMRDADRIHDDPLISRWVKTVFGILDRWSRADMRSADADTLDSIRSAFNDSAPNFSRPVAIGRQAARRNRQYEAQVEALERNSILLEQAVVSRDGQIADLDEAVRKRDQRVADRDSRLASVTRSLTERDAQLTEREAQIKSLDRAVVERDSQIADLDEAVRKRDQRVADRDSRLASVTRSLTERDAQLTEREAQIKSLDRAVVERDSQIEAIYGSTSWRVTRPLRVLKTALSRFLRGTKRRLSAAIFRSLGFVWRLIPLGALRQQVKGPLLRLLPRRFVDRHVGRRMRSTRSYVASGWLQLADRSFDAANSEGDTPILFDSEYYLAANEDVRSSGEDPLRHYLAHGAVEGRLPFALEQEEIDPAIEALHRIDLRQDDVFAFDAGFYRDLNPDLSPSTDEALFDHYRSYGRDESRAGSRGDFVLELCDDPREIPLDFKASEYIDLYPDLLGLAEQSPLAALRHYMCLGRWEPRLHTSRGDEAIAAPDSTDILRELLPETPPLCVLAHVFYPDLWDELAGYLANLPEHAYDLYVNLVETTCTPELEQSVREAFPAANVVVSQNVGRDIGGHFQLLRNISAEDYRFFCLVHSKKSPHLASGDAILWRRRLLTPLLGTRALAAENLKLMLTDEAVGLVGARLCRDTALRDNTGKFAELMDMLDVRPESRDVEFVSGTMMYLRREVLQRIFETCKDLPFEKGDDTPLQFHLDAQWAHAIERVIGNVVRDMNYRFEWR